ncbi:G2/mitotic-specific cyclin-B2-like [Amblyomma americanum]
MRRLWIAALFLAAKYEETQGPLVSIRFMETMKYISDFQLRDVWEMERDILRAVNWSLTRPLSVNFLSRNCKAAQATKVEEMTATYILEVCLLDYCMAWVKPSRRAAAALCCALLLLGRPKDCWDRKMEYYSGYSLKDLQPFVRRMAKLTLDAAESENKAPYDKYKADCYGNVGRFSKTKARNLRLMTNGIC